MSQPFSKKLLHGLNSVQKWLLWLTGYGLVLGNRVLGNVFRSEANLPAAGRRLSVNVFGNIIRVIYNNP